MDNKALSTLFMGVFLVISYSVLSANLDYWLKSFLKGEDYLTRGGIDCIYSAIFISNASYVSSESSLLVDVENIGYENITGIEISTVKNDTNEITDSFKLNDTVIRVGETVKLDLDVEECPDKVVVRSKSCPSVSEEYLLGV